MESIRSLYRIGAGPSSSHTMGPRRAAQIFLKNNPNAASFRVTLYASLAATGKGHLTDKVLHSVLGDDKLVVIWKPEESLPFHPNGMYFEALDESGALMNFWTVYSIGGGALSDGTVREEASIYPLTQLQDILQYLAENGLSFWEYVESIEGSDIWEFLAEIWDAMQQSVERGIIAEGVLPGGLGLARKAYSYYRKAQLSGPHFKQNALLTAYALAVSEENASGGIIATAPTCGSCGVMPSVLRYIKETVNCADIHILRALATAGLVGNLVKFNASISGAEVGCQGEVGTACAMAAAAATQLLGGTIRQIEYAAEMGLEHHLGLTCDPVLGLVQIPCIERNAHAATRALSCADFALFSDGTHHIDFDQVVQVMKTTGLDLPSLYRETSSGGLAYTYGIKKAGKNRK